MPGNDASHIYLAKANNDVVSHCQCAEALITYPPQLDCPWCGCGWLFTCIECRKAFTFAKGVIVEESWEQTAMRDLRTWQEDDGSVSPWAPEGGEVAKWIEVMKDLLSEVRVGEQYVCLDGLIIPTNATSVRFEGWHSRHDLPFVPQVQALRDRSVVSSLLSNPEYWQSAALDPDGALDEEPGEEFSVTEFS
jgi:hypothetical protein